MVSDISERELQQINDALQNQPTLDEVGITGLKRQGGFVQEEFLKDLQGDKWRKVVREMIDQEPIIHSVLFAIKMLMRRVTWRFRPANESAEAKRLAEWFTGALFDDMSQSWNDTNSEIDTFLEYGWSLLETNFKLRQGDSRDSKLRSKFNDGLYGWRKWSIRSQDTLSEWKLSEDGGIDGMVQLDPITSKTRTIPIVKSLLFRTSVSKGNPEGKALAIDTPIPTPDGWRTMGDLHPHDRVFDENGNIRHVIAVSEVWKNRPTYKLTFGDGSSIVADENHIWETRDAYERGKWLDSSYRTTGTIYETQKTANGGSNHSIELSGKLKYVAQNLLIKCVERVESVPTVCIQVDSPSQMFLAGTSMIPTHNSVLRSAYQPWYFANKIRFIEGIGIERDLAGLPIMYVPPELLKRNATAEQRQMRTSYEQLITGIRRDQREGALLPMEYDSNGNQRYKFELLSSSGNRQFDTDKTIVRYEQRMAMCVLGDVILLGHDSVGSKALSVSKVDLLVMALYAWLDMKAGIINTHAIPRLARYNGFDLSLLPILEHGDIEQVSIEEISQLLTALTGAGAMIFPSTDGELERHLLLRGGLPSDGVPKSSETDDSSTTEAEPQSEQEEEIDNENPKTAAEGQPRKFHLRSKHNQKSHGNRSGKSTNVAGKTGYGANVKQDSGKSKSSGGGGGSSSDNVKPSEPKKSAKVGKVPDRGDDASTLTPKESLKESKAWSDSLTSKERNFTRFYTQEGSYTINKSLRNPPPKPDQNQVASIDSAISKSKVKKDIVVYRGLSGVSASSLKVGSVVSDKGYVSTSVSSKVARDFASKRDGVVMNIKVKAGKNAAHVSEMAGRNRNEAEVLLPRGSKFKVVGKKKPDIVEVEML